MLKLFHYPQASCRSPQHCGPPAHPLLASARTPGKGLAWRRLAGVRASLRGALPRQWALPGVRLNFPTLLVQRTKRLVPPPKAGPPRPLPWQHEDPWGGQSDSPAGQGGGRTQKGHSPNLSPTSQQAASPEGGNVAGWRGRGGGGCRQSGWR